MPLDAKTVALLEERTGHKFANLERLEQALTHSSVQVQAGESYERLEFLGDRVLGVCISEMLYNAFPDAAEGELSVRLNALVNAETCAAIADEMALANIIRTGADIKTVKDKRLANVRADVIEALIATIYLDGGLSAARSFIDRYWKSRSQETGAARRDAKTELQEWAHQQGNLHPVYEVIDRSGPDHDPQFTVEVKIAGFPAERGDGRSKRLAQQVAAEKVLLREGVWKED